MSVLAKDRVTEIVQAALTSARDQGLLSFEGVPEITIEVPRSKEHGDFSCNVAMALAREAGLPPRSIAEHVVKNIAEDGIIERTEIAGAGFINFYLKPGWLHDIVRDIDEQGAEYGRSDAGKDLRVLLEFVSANPNGPITVASARGGVIGDTLARLYELTGAAVAREYYINDAANSTQMINFGKSVVVRYLQELGKDVEMPEDGYQGDYVTQIAREIAEKDGDKWVAADEEQRLTEFTRRSEAAMIDQQREDLEEFGITFDRWFSERSLHDSGKVKETVDLLTERGYTYEQEGAVWLRSSAFGDDKDRALVRSNGQPTYIAADAAYHADKFRRGWNKLINIWGADHHGYVPRTKAAIAALGYPAEELDVIIYQTVRLFSGGELVMMSKRAGDVISLSELMREVGRDAARYFLLMRSYDSPLDFDLELAKSESEENPIYYVQYAHARIAAILRKAQEEGWSVPAAGDAHLELITEEAETDLIKKLGSWPEEVATAAFQHEPHRLAPFAIDLARLFHKFYTDCRVLGEDRLLSEARLTLVKATRTVLANLLNTMGVSAPERM
ncbi:MAG: arginine--tRNA ligase [Armatimonadetes bacterium]|nr:arginine--tRNA ligase [Armatimonadota bacterium]